MVDFLGIDSTSWSAIQTIIITITGAAAFIASYRAMQEIRKDRKVGFIRMQLDELYSLILEGDFSLNDTDGVLSTDSFYKAKSKKYLAGPKLGLEFEEYSKVWETPGPRTTNPKWIEQMSVQGVKLRIVGNEEREDLDRELNRLIFR